MGWAVGFDQQWGRDIGYGVPALCDHPDCSEEIDRGLSYVCGGEPYGGEHGCGLYFCGIHLIYTMIKKLGSTEEIVRQLCGRCRYSHRSNPFEPKPDIQEWIDHKMTHESWAEWRRENGIGGDARQSRGMGDIHAENTSDYGSEQ